MLDKIRKIRWAHVAYFFVGVASLCGLAMLMGLVSEKDQQQRVSGLRVLVEGKETFIDQQDVSDMLTQHFGELIGHPLNGLQLQAMEDELRKSPYVSKADVYADMDGLLQVRVQQREVLLRVICEQSGQQYYVDGQGQKIPVTLKYVPRVMVASGYIKEGYEKALEQVSSPLVLDLMKIVQRTENDPLWRNQIVQLYVNPSGDIQIVPRVGKQELIIGSADSLDSKLARLERFYTQILPRVGTEAYRSVNVKFGGQIICERQGDWYIDSLQMMMNKK